MVKESMLFLYYGGNCGDALSFYQQVLGADVLEKTTYGAADMAETEAQKPLVMNSTFALGGVKFCASDVPGAAPTAGTRLSVWLEFDGEDAFTTVYRRFQQSDCKVLAPLEETFWNSVYAKVQDPFGITWELNFQK